MKRWGGLILFAIAIILFVKGNVLSNWIVAHIGAFLLGVWYVIVFDK